MAGGYRQFGKSQKWLAGSAFFVEKLKMAGGYCIFSGKLVAGSAFFVEKVKNGWRVVPFWKSGIVEGYYGYKWVCGKQSNS